MPRRKIYETPEDLANEKLLAIELGWLKQWEYHKFEKLNWADYWYSEPGETIMIAAAECKRRRNHSDKYDTFFISRVKFNKLHDTTFSRGCYIVVGYDDCIKYLRVDGMDRSTLAVRDGGRTDRGDKQDIEKVVHIPIKLFTSI